MDAHPWWRTHLCATDIHVTETGWLRRAMMCPALLISLALFLTSTVVSAATVEVANQRGAIISTLNSGHAEWRLLGLTLPNQSSADLNFREVHLFAPGSAVLRPTATGFERLPREPLRVFVGGSDSVDDDVAVLIQRADGRVQGSWDLGGTRYELEMGLSEAAIRMAKKKLF